MLVNERENRKERLLQVAQMMMTAARTAPKGKGFDIIEIALVLDEDIKKLSAAMLDYSDSTGLKFVQRDAENILVADAVILIGTKQQIHNLNCSYCGFNTCEEKNQYPDVPCSLNTVDVGIALGSACSMAADLRVDSRIMFSVGRVAQDLNLLPGCNNIYGIPISCTSKNPFFDRVSKTPQVK